MNTAIFLLWLQSVTEAVAVIERLFALKKQSDAGEEITEEQLLAAQEKTHQTVDALEAAGVHDREDGT